jgi:hypothetical protein
MRLDPTSLRLRIVPLSQLRLHEDFDPWRARRLEVSLRHQQVLKNPVIVAEAGDIYIVLDGATRVTALTELGFPHVLVQVVSYEDPSVRLRTWKHVLVGLPSSSLAHDLGRLAPHGTFVCDLPELQAALNARRCLLGVLAKEGHAIAFPNRQDTKEEIRLLSQAVATYRGKAEVHRAAEVDLPALLTLHPGLTAIILFPPFTPADVTHCATNETKLPMGITRHLIGGRALGVNVPLEVLASNQPLEEKNAWLHDRMQSQLHHNRVRLYEEPTFVFDE